MKVVLLPFTVLCLVILIYSSWVANQRSRSYSLYLRPDLCYGCKSLEQDTQEREQDAQERNLSWIPVSGIVLLSAREAKQGNISFLNLPIPISDPTLFNSSDLSIDHLFKFKIDVPESLPKDHSARVLIAVKDSYLGSLLKDNQRFGGVLPADLQGRTPSDFNLKISANAVALTVEPPEVEMKVEPGRPELFLIRPTEAGWSRLKLTFLLTGPAGRIYSKGWSDFMVLVGPETILGFLSDRTLKVFQAIAT